MERSLVSKVAVCVLLFAIGFSLISGNVSPVKGYVVIGRGCLRCGYWSGGRYFYYSGYYYMNGYYYYGGYPGSGYYQTVQYQLTLNTNPSSLSGVVSGGGTYNSGSTASFSANQSISQSQGTRYVFTGWTGDYSGSGASGSVTMNTAKTITAVYQLQYYAAVSQQPTTAPAPQGGGWFNAGDTASISVPSQTVSQNAGSQLVFNGWSVDGSSNQAGSTLSLQMNGPHTVIAQYKQQYYLTVSTDQGTVSGQGWYDVGTNAQISATPPPNPSFGVSIVFNGWQGSTQSSSQSTTVLMNGPMSVTATWRTDYTVLYATIGAIIAIAAAGAAVFFKNKRGKTTAAPTSPTVTS
jgi:List-Bact-rpt repeat protein